MSNLLERYEAWSAQRQAIFDVEGETGVLDHDAIHNNEDDACDLLDKLAEALKAVREGVAAISDALGDHWAFYQCGFTCSEAEAFYEANLALGLEHEAEFFMRHHAESDDDIEDQHEPLYEYPTNSDCVSGWRRKDHDGSSTDT